MYYYDSFDIFVSLVTVAHVVEITEHLWTILLCVMALESI